MNLNLTKEQKFYLCRLAALQFPGSVANYSTRRPIHLLLQRSGEYIPMTRYEFEDDEEELALLEYGDDNCSSYSSVEDLVAEQLGIENSAEEIEKYNQAAQEDREVQFVTYAAAMETNHIPGHDDDIYDLEDYLAVYGINIDAVRMYRLPDAWEVNALAFTHKGIEEAREEIANHLFRPTRYYAATTCDGDYPVLMDVLHMYAKACLNEETIGLRWIIKTCLTPEEVVDRFKRNPNKEFLVADYIFTLPAVRRYNGTDIQKMELQVRAAGEMRQFGRTQEPIYPVSKVQVTLTCEAGSFSCPYPFECDGTCESLQKDENVIRMFNFAYYYNVKKEDEVNDNH